MPTIVPGIPVLGNFSILWVPTIADIDAPSLATELGASAFDLSCYLLADGWEFSTDSNKGTAPRRVCQTSQFERFTTSTYKLKDLRYIIQPQAAAASDGKDAFETLTEGLNGYFVERLGMDPDTALAAGQFVNVIPVTLGEQTIMGGDGDNDDFVVFQPVSVRGTPTQNVALVA
jgi:hypothetical protein